MTSRSPCPLRAYDLRQETKEVKNVLVGTFLEAQWFGPMLSLLERGCFWLKELRSHMSCGMAKNDNNFKRYVYLLNVVAE